MMPSIKRINFIVVGCEAKHLQVEVSGLTFFHSGDIDVK